LKAGPRPTPVSIPIVPETEKGCLKTFCPPPQNVLMSANSDSVKGVAFPPLLGRGPGSETDWAWRVPTERIIKVVPTSTRSRSAPAEKQRRELIEVVGTSAVG